VTALFPAPEAEISVVRMRLLIVGTALAVVGATAAPASAATLCVADRHGCFRTLQKAADAAHDGDTIRLAPGIYRGGVTIGVSVDLRGSGAGVTRIRGGGPVLTLNGRTSSVSGVSISDGVTTSSFLDGEVKPALALGGGVLTAKDSTVTISDSVIERNVTAPGQTVSSVTVQCPDGNPCRYAGGYGAGISSQGPLTLIRTQVIRNRNSGPLSSDSEGGGIFANGPLTIVDSQIVDNEARVQPPYGRYANGAGVFAVTGALTIRHSAVSGNKATIESHWPNSVQTGNIGGGVFVDGGATATIERSRIEVNELRATNTIGDAVAFSGGVHGNGPVSLSDTVVAGNRVTAIVPPGSDATASADSGVGNFNAAGTISGSRLVGNAVTAVGGAGRVLAGAGALFPWTGDGIDIRGSVISGNSVTATGKGETTALGGGILNVGTLSLRGTDVSDNTIRAAGGSGAAQGGGVWNGSIDDSQDVTPTLSATGGSIAGNAIFASRGLDVRGGGLFTSAPAALDHIAIRGNSPGNCSGC
jgi:hypothetical protein